MHDLSQPVAIIIPTLDAQRAEPVAAAALASAGHPARVIVADGPARGFTRTVNAGLQQLRAGEDVCLLNDDIDTETFGKGWLMHLRLGLYLRSGHYGLVGPRPKGTPAYRGVRPAHDIAFWCVLLRREVVDTLGPLDERFTHYFSDYVYCARIRAAGWQIGRVGTVLLRHKGRGSGKTARQWWDADLVLWEQYNANGE